jgi:hypothetical protein
LIQQQERMEIGPLTEFVLDSIKLDVFAIVSLEESE